MSSIETYLQYIASKVWARDVRTAIVNAIRQCYDDVHNPTLNTEALQAAIQAKIDAGQMAALTIGDRTITAAKLALGVIPTPDTTLSQSGVPADAKKTGDEITAINESLDDVKADLVKELLTEDTIPGTTQTVTMTDGKVTQVAHTQGNTTLRTDVFTYSTGSITEVRTLNSGESLTMVTDLATLATSTTYTAS